MDIIRETADKYQPLFNLMSEEHGLTLTISEMDDIIAKVDEVKQLFIPIVSTRTFEKEIELYVDTETDEWVLKHKGVIKKRAKSKFECLLTKQELKKQLGV
jgi:hypothetical protein